MSAPGALAAGAAAACGPFRGWPVLHVSDFHNRLRGFRFARALARELEPRLVVNTGDLSGVGGPVEVALLRAFGRIGAAQVLAPGNHDSALTAREMRRAGARVLDVPRVETVGGVRVWGYPDPNRTRLFGLPYRPELCREAARRSPPPEDGEGPFVVAVHS
ncbi:MAG: metallophosphoesterase family protein, partial [Acidimicrobiales bacterium]